MKYLFKDYNTKHVYIFDSSKLLREYIEDRYETSTRKVVCCYDDLSIDKSIKVLQSIPNRENAPVYVIVGEFWIS